MFYFSDGDCELPESWKGTWFQTGLGQVVINQNSIHPKGYCVTHRDDYFLLNNRLEFQTGHKNAYNNKENCANVLRKTLGFFQIQNQPDLADLPNNMKWTERLQLTYCCLSTLLMEWILLKLVHVIGDLCL